MSQPARRIEPAPSSPPVAAVRLRHPLTPLAYLAVTTSPAPYRLFARTVDVLYPSRHRPTPPALDTLVREVSRLRGLEPAGESPWVVRFFARPRHPERLQQANRLRDDPDVAFYLSLVPRYAEGHALLALIPLDARQVASALLRYLPGRKRRGA